MKVPFIALIVTTSNEVVEMPFEEENEPSAAGRFMLCAMNAQGKKIKFAKAESEKGLPENNDGRATIEFWNGKWSGGYAY